MLPLPQLWDPKTPMVSGRLIGRYVPARPSADAMGEECSALYASERVRNQSHSYGNSDADPTAGLIGTSTVCFE